MNNAKRSQCSSDCVCSVCRQLSAAIRPSSDKSSNSKKSKRSASSSKKCSQTKCVNENFILKKSVNDFRHMNMMMDNNPIKKSLSYQEISKKLEANYQNNYRRNFEEYKKMRSTSNLHEEDEYHARPLKASNSGSKLAEHKTVIYFGDSFRKDDDNKTKQGPTKEQDLYHARRLCEELQFNRQNSVRRSKNFSALRKKAEAFAKSRAALEAAIAETPPPPPKEPNAPEPKLDFFKNLKSVLEEKTRNIVKNKNEDCAEPGPSRMNKKQVIAEVRQGVTENMLIPEPVFKKKPDKPPKRAEKRDKSLPSYIESVVNGVINIRIEENFQAASQIVKQIHQPEKKRNKRETFNESTIEGTAEIEFFDEDIEEDIDSREDFDWSFVQEWRSRPSGNPRIEPSNCKQQNAPPYISPGMHQIATSNPVSPSNRIQSPLVATSALKVAKEVSLRPISEQCNPNVSPMKRNDSPNVCKIPPAPKMPDNKAGNVYIANSIATGNQMTPSKANGMTEVMAHPGKVTPQKATVGKIPSVEGQLMRGLAKIQSTVPTRITVQSQPVKAQPAMISSGLERICDDGKKNSPSKGEANLLDDGRKEKSENFQARPNIPSSPNQNGLPVQQAQKPNGPVTRTHHHNGAHEIQRLQRVQECHSSSDENRSSGHASMSDGHGSSSPGMNRNTSLGPLPEDRLAAGVTNRSTRSKASNGRARNRNTPAKVPWNGGGLEDIKQAIQQLTMRSQTSTSTYSSLSAGSESSEPVRRLGRYSSMETINTNVTSADEFVWVDSHNRLVELQHPPWSQHCVMRVIKSGRCREHADRVSIEAVPRLGYLLQRALVRVAREIQRLSGGLGLCAKHEVASAYKIVLCPALADSCIKACLRAAAMFQVPGDGAIKQSKSARAGLQLPVGRFHRWMVDARLGRFVHEYAAVYLCAGMENLLEEVLLQCLPTDNSVPLTATGLEHAIAASGDLWGLLQPYAHLNAGRIASGALTMPRWASQSSIGSGSTSHGNSPGLEPCLLTTCVGSLAELKDLVVRAQQRSQHITLSHGALRALFYFMRCSQLEHNEAGSTISSSSNIQELCYERAYVVLPPLVEWLRVASAHAEYRHAILIDKDDIMQAARLLLPGVDCPPRPMVSEEDLPSKRQNVMLNHSGSNQGSLTSSCSSGSASIEESGECGRRATIALAFKLMLSGRPELLIQALSLVPSTTRYDTMNHQGLTALMIAAIRNDESALQTLLDAGADPNVEVPSSANQNYPAVHPETQHWTAATFAACRGNYNAVRILLERSAHVEGGARLSEDKCTITPLQASCGSMNADIVVFLLSHGAHAFLSTQQKDTLCFVGTAQRGSYSAISVAASHGQRGVLRKLLAHPMAPGSREVLSLEEMLAEGDGNARIDRQSEAPPTLNKTQVKCLQEAMYHSAENNHLDITLELRALGVPWTLHCWMHALAAAHELRLDAVIDQLLQDFLQVCPDDYSQQFVMECLPLLFNIFRYSKKEGTTILLADIFSTCFGAEQIKPVKEPALQPSNGSRIDPKFVNNPELSDVTFRVEGRIFYGHKIVLVTASPRLQSMLSSKVNEGNATPTVQINDIRYHIFELVMQFLYSGGCHALDVATGDVLELMAAASFFQLEKLLRFTEARCAEMVNIDNVVAMYIHAKVYNAVKLMEYCQGFLLQNMVALLTYDDSVKRLMFAKKIPNHDVLNGLLLTLQHRIKSRKPINGSLGSSPATNMHHRVPGGVNNAHNMNKKSK